MIRARAALAAALVVALACALAARDASAYVRYKTEANQPFHWKQTCVPISFYPSSMVDAAGGMDMTPEEIAHAVTSAAGAWSASMNTCTFLQLNASASDAVAPPARNDGKNSVIFQTRNWCGPRTSTNACSYDALALAITSIFVVKSDGTIKDADIEVNSSNFIWTDLDLDPNTGKQDLQNALTHEMGHLIGLDHTCYLPSAGGARGVDNHGDPVPDCSSAPASVQATTMFASANPGDLEKRSLAPDDTQAVCDIYPAAADPGRCPTVADVTEEPSGCAVGADAVGDGRGRIAGTAGLAVAALAIWLAQRRRARRP